jgi:uncharacterized lipoprotein YajG
VKFVKTLCIAIAALLLAGCAASTRPSPESGPSPLVVSSCPPLQPLSDDSFGAVVSKLVEVSNTYRECRAAALAGVKPAPQDTSCKGFWCR